MKTLFDFSNNSTLLNYALNSNPSPLQAGGSGELQIVVNNPGETAILLKQIVILMLADDPEQRPPYYEAINLLATTCPSGVASIVSSDQAPWQVGQAENVFTFAPQSAEPVQMEGQALTITFQNLPTSTVVGTAQVTVEEWANANGAPPDPNKRQPPSGSVTVDIAKFPQGFAVMRFTATPLQVAQGGSCALAWSASGGVQTICYGEVSIPLPNDPPLAESDYYVVKNLESNPTIFTLTSTDPSSGLFVQNQITVSVDIPPVPSPAILSFTASSLPGDQTRLSWKTRNASQVEINDVGVYDNEEAASFSKTVPAQATYIMSATGLSGSSPSVTYADCSISCLEMTGDPNSYVNFDRLSNSFDSSNATIEAWVQTTAQTCQTVVLVCQPPGAAPRVSIESNSRVGVYWSPDGSGGGYTSTDTTDITDGAWHHIAVVFDQSNITFYKDGVQLDTIAMNGQLPAAGGLQLGASLGTDVAYDGLLYDVRVWNIARTSDEINEFRDQPFTAPTPNLIAAISFAGGQATDVISGSVGDLVCIPSFILSMPPG